MTHHAPHRGSLHPRYAADLLSVWVVAERLARCFPTVRDPAVLPVRLPILSVPGFSLSRAAMRMPTIWIVCAPIRRSVRLRTAARQPRGLVFAADVSRLENGPSSRDAVRLTWALVDQWMVSYDQEPVSVILDIDHTCDVVHGHQQLSLFNAHYDERCFLPIHVYDTERSRPVAVVLRPGKTPSGIPIGRCAIQSAPLAGTSMSRQSLAPRTKCSRAAR